MEVILGIRDIVEGHLRGKAFQDPVEGNGLFPRRDWKYEVDNDDTSLGYEDWLDGKIEIECDTAEHALERMLHAAPRAFLGDSDADQAAQIVEDVFVDFRARGEEAPVRARGLLVIEDRELIFGETCGILPRDMLDDIGRIAHLAMIAHEGGTSQELIDRAIHQFGLDYGIASEEVSLARRRQGIDPGDDPVQGGPC